MDFKVDEIMKIDDIPGYSDKSEYTQLCKCVLDFDIEDFFKNCTIISESMLDEQLFQSNIECYYSVIQNINTKIGSMTFNQISILPIKTIIEKTCLNNILIDALNTKNVMYALELIDFFINSNHEFGKLFIDSTDKILEFFISVSDLDASLKSFNILFWIFKSLEKIYICNFGEIMTKAIEIEVPQGKMYELMEICLEKCEEPNTYIEPIMLSLNETFNPMYVINIKNILIQIKSVAQKTLPLYDFPIFKKVLREIFNTDANVAHQILYFISIISFDENSHALLNETIPYTTLIDLANTDKEVDTIAFFNYINNMFEFYEDDICNDDIIDALIMGALYESSKKLKESTLLLANTFYLEGHFNDELSNAVLPAVVDWLNGDPSSSSFLVILNFTNEIIKHLLGTDQFTPDYFEEIGLVEALNEILDNLEDEECAESVSSILKMLNNYE